MYRCVHCKEVYTVQRCTLYRGEHCAYVYTVQMCTLCRGVHCTELYTVQMCTLCRGVHCTEVYTVQMCTNVYSAVQCGTADISCFPPVPLSVLQNSVATLQNTIY